MQCKGPKEGCVVAGTHATHISPGGLCISKEVVTLDQGKQWRYWWLRLHQRLEKLRKDKLLVLFSVRWGDTTVF